ncbi:MAG: type IV pilus modification protein PilV [Gammaproteobacteria bacterium]|nr:type IV pilus modification protein PilV [Gammaproteobacteria bacterium]
MEVLVALLVIAIGLLGTIALQTRAMQMELESYQRVQALNLLDDMASRLAANRANRGCYRLENENPSYVGVGSPVVETMIADNTHPDCVADIAAWDQLLRGAPVEEAGGNMVGAMIGARGCIEQLAPREYRISIAWQGMQATSANVDLTCAQGLYGDDDTMRRVVARTVEFADLGF